MTSGYYRALRELSERRNVEEVKAQKTLYFPTAAEAEAYVEQLAKRLGLRYRIGDGVEIRPKKRPDGTTAFRIALYDEDGFVGYLTAEYVKHLSGEKTIAQPTENPDKYADLSDLALQEEMKEVAERWKSKGHYYLQYMGISQFAYPEDPNTHLEIDKRYDGATYDNGEESRKVAVVIERPTGKNFRRSYPLEKLPRQLSFKNPTEETEKLAQLYAEFIANALPVEHEHLHTDTSGYDEGKGSWH